MHETDEFKGNKVIKLKKDENDQYPFTFGKKKAKLIVENFDAIKKFVEEETDESQQNLSEEKSEEAPDAQKEEPVM